MPGMPGADVDGYENDITESSKRKGNKNPLHVYMSNMSYPLN